MARIVILQHSPFEPPGIIIDALKNYKNRIRYINFYRNPNQQCRLTGYQGLIVLGGQMNPNELKKYPHLQYEIELIQQAIVKDIPVLGVCLGSQLLNLALGGSCYALPDSEYGWVEVRKMKNHPLFDAFQNKSTVFHWHRYGSTPPSGVEIILENHKSVQGFVYKEKHLGVQFHLELNRPLITRWLEHPNYLTQLTTEISHDEIKKIRQDTQKLMTSSMNLGQQFFNTFAKLFKQSKRTLSSR